MSTVSAPFGLEPAFHPSGILRPARYAMSTGYATGILQNQPVKLVGGVINAAAIGDRFIGTFMGCEYTDANGVRQYANQWTASTTGTDIVAIVTLDPATEYRIQANTTVAQTAIGSQFTYTVITGGNTTTGLSAIMLDVLNGAQTNAALQVIGLTPGPDNAWGDNFTIVTVRVSQHQMVADIAEFS